MPLVDVAMLVALVVLVIFCLELEFSSLGRRFPGKPQQLDSFSVERYRAAARLSDRELQCLARDFRKASLVVQVMVAQSPGAYWGLGCRLVVHQALFLGTLWWLRAGPGADAAPLVLRFERLLAQAKAARAGVER